MSALDILANAACEAVPLTILEKRRNNLVKARARIAEIRVQRKAGIIVPKKQVKKNNNPSWRSENIKKAQAALRRKRLLSKLLAQDTEPESEGDPQEEEEEVT